MLNNTFKLFLQSLPVWVYKPWISPNLISVYYHLVSDHPLQHVSNLYTYKTPEMFESDLEYLGKNYNLVSYEDVLDHIFRQRPLKPNAFLLTFDDGFSECFSVVRPLLLSLGIPCTFFVATNFIDNKDLSVYEKISLCLDAMDVDEDIYHSNRSIFSDLFHWEFESFSQFRNWILKDYKPVSAEVDQLCALSGVDVTDYLLKVQPYLTINQIEIMHSEGFTIGSHSLGHEVFSDLSEEDACQNILQSIHKIKKITNKSRIPFAFPHSARGVSEELMQNLWSNYTDVGLFFDSKGIIQRSNIMISRFCGDSPLGSKSGKSNLHSKIKLEYFEAFSEQFK